MVLASIVVVGIGISIGPSTDIVISIGIGIGAYILLMPLFSRYHSATPYT